MKRKHPRKHPHRPFFSAREEARTRSAEDIVVETPQTESLSYRLAYLDPDFMLRPDMRPIRLQLELLKPELALVKEKIESTVVVFGSARILEQKAAKQALVIAEVHLKKDPENISLLRAVKIAEAQLAKSKYYDEARKLGSLISKANQTREVCQYVVVTGGGPGIMEAANRGAHDVNAKSIGLNIVLPFEQLPNIYITPELAFRFHYFAIRKLHFLIRARALIAFPGGFGTFDELFEALTLLQTQKIEPIPVLLFGRSYWSKAVKFEELVDEGMISEADLKLFQYVETAEEAWQAIQNFYSAPTVS